MKTEFLNLLFIKCQIFSHGLISALYGGIFINLIFSGNIYFDNDEINVNPNEGVNINVVSFSMLNSMYNINQIQVIINFNYYEMEALLKQLQFHMVIIAFIPLWNN